MAAGPDQLGTRRREFILSKLSAEDRRRFAAAESEIDADILITPRTASSLFRAVAEPTAPVLEALVEIYVIAGWRAETTDRPRADGGTDRGITLHRPR